jgi:hypothetical protein
MSKYYIFPSLLQILSSQSQLAGYKTGKVLGGRLDFHLFSALFVLSTALKYDSIEAGKRNKFFTPSEFRLKTIFIIFFHFVFLNQNQIVFFTSRGFQWGATVWRRSRKRSLISDKRVVRRWIQDVLYGKKDEDIFFIKMKLCLNSEMKGIKRREVSPCLMTNPKLQLFLGPTLGLTANFFWFSRWLLGGGGRSDHNFLRGLGFWPYFFRTLFELRLWWSLE